MSEKLYSYILECQIKGEPITKEGTGTCLGTYHQANLKAITEAVRCLKEKCEVEIYTTDAWVASMFNNNFKLWQKLKWQKSVGGKISNQQEWIELSKVIEGHEVSMTSGSHEYYHAQQYNLMKLGEKYKQLTIEEVNYGSTRD